MRRRATTDETVIQVPPDVIFSLDDGIVWASWPGKSASVELGQYEAVKLMMQDFLEQSALGDRLSARRAGDR